MLISKISTGQLFDKDILSMLITSCFKELKYSGEFSKYEKKQIEISYPGLKDSCKSSTLKSISVLYLHTNGNIPTWYA